MTSKFEQCSVIFLHGFASGPVTTKTQFLREHLENLGCSVSIPDLNGDSFEAMTLTSQLRIAESALSQVQPGQQIILIGSGMGGVLATIKSQQIDGLRGLILLSPGFGLLRRWSELLGPELLGEWRQTGTMDVYHYQAERELPLRYDFFLDAQRYQTDELVVRCPTLVFHGRRDETIPADVSKKFAKLNPKTVELCLLDDAELVMSLDVIWDKTVSFIEKVLAVPAH